MICGQNLVTTGLSNLLCEDFSRNKSFTKNLLHFSVAFPRFFRPNKKWRLAIFQKTGLSWTDPFSISLNLLQCIAKKVPPPKTPFPSQFQIKILPCKLSRFFEQFIINYRTTQMLFKTHLIWRSQVLFDLIKVWTKYWLNSSY